MGGRDRGIDRVGGYDAGLGNGGYRAQTDAFGRFSEQCAEGGATSKAPPDQ